MDISTLYTRELNRSCGRKGYCLFDKEKVTVISPQKYGEFCKGEKRNGSN